MNGAEPLDSLAHIIQTALTPMFLLSGIGTLISVFNTRLARVSDHVEHLTETLRLSNDTPDVVRILRHLARLGRRRLALDAAVVLAALAGAFTCAAAFALFLVTLRDAASSMLLLWLFGGALGCTIAALLFFLTDTVLAWHGLRMDGPMPRPKA